MNENTTDKKASVVNAIALSTMNRMYSKQITVNGTRLEALIDTDSQVTIIRKDVYNKIKPNTLSGDAICLTGLGKNEMHSLGCFETVIEIDREQFPCTIHVVPNYKHESYNW